MSQLTNSSFDFRLNQTSVLSFLNLELVHIFQLAVSQGAGGVNSSAIGAWLAEALITWFCENRNLESQEVAEFLETILNRELNLIVEDGSTDEVGTLLCDFFGICSTKSEAEIIDKVRSLPKCDLSRCRVDKNDGDVLDDESLDSERQNVEQDFNEMDIDEETPAAPRQPRFNPVDPDGWTTIVSKKKK